MQFFGAERGVKWLITILTKSIRNVIETQKTKNKKKNKQNKQQSHRIDVQVFDSRTFNPWFLG